MDPTCQNFRVSSAREKQCPEEGAVCLLSTLAIQMFEIFLFINEVQIEIVPASVRVCISALVCLILSLFPKESTFDFCWPFGSFVYFKGMIDILCN